MDPAWIDVGSAAALAAQGRLDVEVDGCYVAIVRFEQLREEYKRLASDYSLSSMDKLREMKRQVRAAKAEFRMALEQWRRYQSFLMATVPA